MKREIINDTKSLKSEESPAGMKRRDFFKLLGGGIFIFIHPFDPSVLFVQQAFQGRSLSKDFNAFLQITEEGLVNCYTGKIEMGQGAIPSLPQIMADELEVPYERVKMFMGRSKMNLGYTA